VYRWFFAETTRSERFLFLSGGRFFPHRAGIFLEHGFSVPPAGFSFDQRFWYPSKPRNRAYRLPRRPGFSGPEKTEVYACREGTVQEIGYNALYGNYVLLKHEGGWTSLYGHLSAVLTVLHKNLQSGSLLGRVGSTGQSTGPHLHFELRQNGKPLNPANVLPTRGIER